MSRSEGGKSVSKRFFVQSTTDWHRRLRILAATFDSTAEKFGGRLLEEGIERLEDELKRNPPRQAKRTK
jgi:hypothetical protein